MNVRNEVHIHHVIFQGLCSS